MQQMPRLLAGKSTADGKRTVIAHQATVLLPAICWRGKENMSTTTTVKFSPRDVVQMLRDAARFGIRQITGDLAKRELKDEEDYDSGYDYDGFCALGAIFKAAGANDNQLDKGSNYSQVARELGLNFGPWGTNDFVSRNDSRKLSFEKIAEEFEHALDVAEGKVPAKPTLPSYLSIRAQENPTVAASDLRAARRIIADTFTWAEAPMDVASSSNDSSEFWYDAYKLLGKMAEAVEEVV